MGSKLTNGNSGLRALTDYLAQTRQMIGRVNRAAGETIRKNDSGLYKLHSDRAPAELIRLMQETQRATANGDDPNLPENKISNINKIRNSAGVKGQGLFRLSEKQIWANFAREISKSLKRNI